MLKKSLKKIFIILIGVLFWGVENVWAYSPSDPMSPKDPLAEFSADPVAGVSLFTGRIINATLSIVGSIALVMFIYAGFKWMTARGNSEQVNSAQEIMLWTALGLAVIFSSYVILNFVFAAIK